MQKREIVLPFRRAWLSSLHREGLVPPARVVAQWERSLASDNLGPRMREKLNGGLGKLASMGLYSRGRFEGGPTDQLETAIKNRFGYCHTAGAMPTRRSDYKLKEVLAAALWGKGRMVDKNA